MDTLGIDVGASDSDNMTTFKKMTVDPGAFRYEEVPSRLVSDAEQDQQMPRTGITRGRICAQTRRGRRNGSRPLLAQREGGILELHEEVALSGADGVWVGP